MKTTEKTIWGIHSQADNLLLEAKNPVIAIGWKKMGDLSQIKKDRESFKEKYSKVYPEATKSSVAGSASQLYKFCVEMKIGDLVVFPSKTNREINIGVIESDYYYDENQYEYANLRKVKWLKHLPRTMFSQGALYEFGSFLSVFQISQYADEVINALEKNSTNVYLQHDESIQEATINTKQATKDYILKELYRLHKGGKLEDVVTDLLRAMGYDAKRTQISGDHGVDVIAYKDELPPRVVVQVKSKNGDIAEADLNKLGGVLKTGDYGLFVTLSNYTKNAKKYIDDNPRIKSINGEEFVELILKFYDKMSDEFKQSIKLEMVYIPR